MPSRNLYTADPHFGHTNILKHSKRPFGSVAAMDAAIIERFRATVTAQDDLWIIGDLAWSQQAGQAAFHAIPGRKHLVKGNHDFEPWVTKLPWTSVHELVEVRDQKQIFVLCHYPLVTWRGIRRGAVHLFGHVHENWAGCKGAVNVGVDLWDFTPIDGATAVAKAQTMPPNPLWEQAEPGLS
jgi:calcineurin-like phosphoesterase family protein